MAKLTKRAVQEAIEEYDGNIAAIARAFGLSRNTIYIYVKERFPDLWELVESKREEWLDDCEATLIKKAKKGDTTALIFIMKTQGKKRGYVERQEVTGADGGPLTLTQLEIINPDVSS